MRGWVTDDSINFHSPIFSWGTILDCLFLRDGDNLYQIWGEDREIIVAPKHLADFRFVASLRNRWDLNWIMVEIEAKFRTFSPL